MAIAYWTVAAITLAIILNAFLKDGTAQKVSTKAFVFIGVATFLWPITLPFILRSQWRITKIRYQAIATDKILRKEENVMLSTLRH
jgi:uncharacterized protein (DUF2062 family)